MQITDMLNQYNRNIANGTEIAGGTQGLRQLTSSLGQMSVGNVFEGSINHMENGVVTLGLSDGKTIQAKLDSGVSVRVGESMFFQVRSNNGAQIAIRPFSQAGGMNPALLNALKAASLPADGKMVTMVNSMMEQSMPIDKQSLAQMAKLVAGNGRMDVATIVQMAKLNIPVTDEMAAQFENYKSDQYAILDQLESVMETVPEKLSGEGQSIKALLDFNRQMIDVLLGRGEAAGDGKVIVSEGAVQQTEGEAVNLALAEGQNGQNAVTAEDAGKTLLHPEAEIAGRANENPAGAAGVQSGMQEADAAGKTGAWVEADAAGKAGAWQEAEAAGKTGAQQENGTAGGSGIRQEAGLISETGVKAAGESGILQEDGVTGETGARQGIQNAGDGLGLGSENGKNTAQNVQPDMLKNIFGRVDLQQLSSQLAKIPELSQNPAVFADGAPVSDLTSKELLAFLGQAFSSRNPFSRQALSELASSKEYRALIRNVMEQQWLLKPEELKGEHKVSELYERLDRQMAQMEKVLKAFGQNTPQMSDTASNVRSNIQFMNHLNQTYAYVQIPLRLAGQNAHSDLYVYTDKRKKREKGDELTAFLHLDLDHLGSTDVSIKLRNRQVATDFYLADDLSYQLLSENIELLEKRLLEKGYQAKIHISNQEEKVNFVEDILKQGTPSAGGMVHRYSFDVRA